MFNWLWQWWDGRAAAPSVSAWHVAAHGSHSANAVCGSFTPAAITAGRSPGSISQGEFASAAVQCDNVTPGVASACGSQG